MPERKNDISATEDMATQGAVATPIYARRDVMHYAVTDHELNSVTYFNSHVAIFSSLASFLLAVVISIVISLVIEDEKPEVTLALGVVAAIVFILSLCTFGLACVAWRARNSEVDAIKGLKKD